MKRRTRLFCLLVLLFNATMAMAVAGLPQQMVVSADGMRCVAASADGAAVNSASAAHTLSQMFPDADVSQGITPDMFSRLKFADMAPLVTRRGVQYASADDICGDWVSSIASGATTAYYVGEIFGRNVTFEKATDSDSLVIRNLYTADDRMMACYHSESSTITMPKQVINESGAVISKGFTYEDEVTLHINDDGTLSGYVVIKDTEFKVMLEKANGSLAARQVTSENGTAVTKDVRYAVVTNQAKANCLQVKNFGNNGRTVEILLCDRPNVELTYQVCREYIADSQWWVMQVNGYDAATGLPTGSVSYRLQGTVDADDASLIHLNDWAGVASDMQHYFGIYTQTVLTAAADIEFSQNLSPGFVGSGTIDEPYLLSTPQDLMLLASRVNDLYGTKPESDGNAYVYADTYFKLANDIDMTGLRFIPIGRMGNIRFAGHFDGAGHTIRNLDINTGFAGYAGLFGKVASTATLTGIKLDNVVIRTRGNYAGAIVANFEGGTLTDCEVAGADVLMTGAGDTEYHLAHGQYAAGMVGLVDKIMNCVVSDSRVSGSGGYVAGMASVVTSQASHCHGINLDVAASNDVIYESDEDKYSDNLMPSGGLFALLDHAVAQDCSFAGAMGYRGDAEHPVEMDLIDWGERGNADNTTYSGAQYLGGIAGQIIEGSMSRCFVVGRCLGQSQIIMEVFYDWEIDDYSTKYYKQNISGGLVGHLNGKIENCYAVGNLSARMHGGMLAGLASTGSRVENCYYSGSANYGDGIVGEDGGKATVDNCYYDLSFIRGNATSQGRTTPQLTTADGPGFTSDEWTYQEGFYPMLKGYENDPMARLGATAVFTADGESLLGGVSSAAFFNVFDGVKVTSQNGNFLIDGNQMIPVKYGNDLIIIERDNIYYSFTAKAYTPLTFIGEGTEDNPYLIRDKEDFEQFLQRSNDETSYFDGKYFQIVNDIDFEGQTGTYRAQIFKGALNGLGHKLMNLNGGSNMILRNQGTIENVIIDYSCQLLDGFVFLSEGIVRNCVNHATIIQGTHISVGICTQNRGLISNCINTGDVYFPVTNTWAEIAGICDVNMGVIQNCLNLGTLGGNDELPKTLESRYVAGICGDNRGTIVNCVNLGTILNGTAVYNISNKGTSGCYWQNDDGTYGGDIIGDSLALSEICALNMNNPSDAMLAEGDGEPAWENYDEYSLPMPAGIADMDIVKVTAAEVILADGDAVDHVTRNFHVGQPDGVDWSTDVPVLSFAGNDATISGSYDGVVLLTVTSGESSKTIELTLDAIVSGVEQLGVDTAVVTEYWYGIDGRVVIKPTEGDGKIYIVVQRLNDGSLRTLKVIN